MKLKYFFPFFVAVIAAVFTSCSDDNDPTYLDEIRVSQSYVSLKTSGGSASIDVVANGNWTVSDIPNWLNKFLMARGELEAKEQEMKEIQKRNKKLFK